MRCYDSDLPALTVLRLERDFPGQSTRDSDIIGVTLDLVLDRRNSFMFLVNPRGAYRHGQTFNDSRQEDFAWRAVVDIKPAVRDSGWTVEMAIPWTSLRFDGTHDEQQWGMNLLPPHLAQERRCSVGPRGPARSHPPHVPSGYPDGVRHLRPGRNLTVKPFVLGSSLSGRNAPGGAAESKADAGVELTYGLTPGLTLDLTYCTDFSQADVDQGRVNLTWCDCGGTSAGPDVGFMVINRETTEGGPAYNRTFGADANIRLLGHMSVNSYVAGTAASDGAGDQRAARLAVGWRNQVWDRTAFFNHVGGGFDPDVGFVRRAGVRHLYATVGAHPRPRLSFLQEINPYVEGSAVTNLSGVLETREGALGFGAQFRDGSLLSTEVVDRLERIEVPFAVGGGGVPVGDYAMWEARVSYEANGGRAARSRAELERRSVSGDVSWRAHYRLTIEASAADDDVELPGGAFTADVLRGRVRVASSTRLFGSAFVQYNNGTEQLVTNLRLNWSYAPLSDVFLVLSELRDLAAGIVLDRAVTVKVTRLFGF